ncbi:MAG: phosphopantetheine adenylyltransferase [Archangiaceae bacterium]|nr:phosphopantetheine adenylyltransferase [Archangiaceae bacterium]
MTRDLVVSVLMTAAGAVQLLPLVGVAGPGALDRLYGVRVTDTSAALLLRHRAVLLALVAAVLLTGAWWPPAQALAVGVGLVSKLSYLALWKLTVAPTRQVTRVARADVGSAALLVVAALLRAAPL